MKFSFYHFVRRGRYKLLPLMAGLALAPCLASATQQLFDCTTNVIGIPPNVDAINFRNSASWNIFTPLAPYETANTLTYTNTGTMYGSPGWEFDLGPATTGSRTNWSDIFYNGNGATVEAADNLISDLGGVLTSGGSLLTVQATNIINKGEMIASTFGQIKLVGSNVFLNRSILYIPPISASGSFNGRTNFTPDTAIFDEYWGQGKTNLISRGVWDGITADSSAAPDIDVLDPCGTSNTAPELSFPPVFADSTNIESPIYMTNIVVTNESLVPVTYTNVPTKIFRQGVFVTIGDYNFGSAIGFIPTGSPSNLFQTATVLLQSSSGGSLYIADTLGSLTNRGVLPNGSTLVPGSDPINPCTGPTARPANYNVARTGGIGAAGGGLPVTNFFYDSSFTNNDPEVADVSAYQCYVDDLGYHPYGAAVSNLVGRVVIKAKNLDLNNAIIYNAAASVNIQADNFMGSTSAVVTCQNLSYNLGSRSGNVNVTNLANNGTLPGMNGTVSLWSAVWTNGYATVFTNWASVTNSTDTNSSGGGTLTNTVFTNITEMDFHVLLVDARGLSSVVPVTVQDFILQTNAVINDSMNVAHSFLFNGQRLTLNGALALSGVTLQNWGRPLAPNLLYFTNNGTLNIPQDAYFGGDGATNYDAYVNNGTMNVGGAETIDSAYYESGGNQSASHGYSVTTANGKIQNGSITSGSFMTLSGSILKLDSSTLYASDTLTFNVTNSLYDSGGSAGNSVVCLNGFSLPIKPATGDLLGTAITTESQNGAEVDHVWAGVDRGPTPAGYSNNVALGKLILSPQGSSYFPPLFYFSGAGQSNALYVDMLDLSQITNLEEMVATDPNLVIYYAAAKLPAQITVAGQVEVETNSAFNGQTYYVVANGGNGQIPQEAEEVLNGQLGGHLRWVSGFAGPNSSVDVLINGNTVSVNRALRYSLAIDSNGDGIPNGVDPSPFGTAPLVVSGAVLRTNLPPEKAFAITWLAETNMPYQVQYSTDLLGTNWLPLLNYTNTATTNRTVTVYDTNAMSGQRFYRVSHPSHP